MRQINEKIQTFQGTVNDLRQSLEFTQKEIEDLKHEVNQLQQTKKQDQVTIKHMTDDLQAKSDLIQELEERCNYQEDYSRRNNLQIVGVEEHQDETWEQTASQVTKLLDNKMQLQNVEVERAHRVGRRTDQRPRPIIACFTRFCDREAVLRNAAKLRGTSIYVNEDLCSASQRIRKEKMPMLKQARSDGKIAYFRHTRLVIKERPGGHTGAGGSQAGAASSSGVGGGAASNGGAASLNQSGASSGAAHTQESDSLIRTDTTRSVGLGELEAGTGAVGGTPARGLRGDDVVTGACGTSTATREEVGTPRPPTPPLGTKKKSTRQTRKH